jgi:hypothetical protein
MSKITTPQIIIQIIKMIYEVELSAITVGIYQSLPEKSTNERQKQQDLCS